MPVRYRAGGTAAVLLAICCGCGAFTGTPPVSDSLEEASVKGVVRLDGKPVNNGTVTFRCANIRRPKEPPREAPIGRDGTYTVKTLVGQNYAVVACKELRTPKYKRHIDNETTIDVQSGENTLNIDIPPVARPAAKSTP
jgi:hypothetical protein